jgi:hypothetical protein
MKLALAELEPDDRDRIGSRLLALLLASPRWRKPASWKGACCVHHPGRVEIVSRAQVEAELRAGGLVADAHEVIARHVGEGSILVWLIVDDEKSAGAALVVVELLPCGRARKKAR